MKRINFCFMLLLAVMIIGCDDGELVQLQKDVTNLV